MAAVEFELKSPLLPLFQGEFSPRAPNPSFPNFSKEGKGRFFAENVAGNYSTNF
jgi:hypothetical protein